MINIQRAMIGAGFMMLCLSAADKPQISVLTIETDNVVTYVGDVNDSTRLATVEGATAPAATKAFTYTLTVGDVVKVNGRPAKGLWSSWAYSMGYSPTAAPGFAISDASQGGVSECKWEIQTEDGLLVGRFMDSGLFPHQITGASGIFLGVSGTQSVVQAVSAPRRASMTEDPSLRRMLGGGTLVHTFHVAPRYPPSFETSSGATEVFHSDFSPVTAASPAHAGDYLVARAANLGFTTPAVDPGAAFPSSSPYHVANAPVEVLVGGQAQDAMIKIGWPGEVNQYRVDFLVPSGTASGTVDLQLRVSGIAGPAVTIPVR
jgi:uncharacterized protein (TIGR03437 family)